MGLAMTAACFDALRMKSDKTRNSSLASCQAPFPGSRAGGAQPGSRAKAELLSGGIACARTLRGHRRSLECARASNNELQRFLFADYVKPLCAPALLSSLAASIVICEMPRNSRTK